MIPLFRKLIIISNTTYLLWFFLPYYSDKLFTDETQGLLTANGFNANDIMSRFGVELGYVFLVLFLVSALGMYFFNNQAKILFVALILLDLFLVLFSGVSVQSNIDVLLFNISIMADAVIIYMAYLTPVAAKFGKKT